jgi:hypothetical protein
MKYLRITGHLLTADYLERIRRTSFLLVLAVSVVGAYALLPARGSGYAVLALRGPLIPGSHGAFGFPERVWYRGAYNSAWVGAQVALLAVLWLSVSGFYLVKNAVERDNRTGVGQILATTPITSQQYVLGKALSNFAFLMTMVGVMALTAGVTQLVRGEDLRVNLWELGSPFFLVVLPVMALVAAMAVLFECTSWLRGGWGNVVYAMVWIAVTTSAVQPYSFVDLLGVSSILVQMQEAARVAFPAYTGSIDAGIEPTMIAPHTFTWPGLSWTDAFIWSRLFWVGIALLLTFGAAYSFSRFDPARERFRRQRQPPRLEQTAAMPGMPAMAVGPMRLTPIPALTRHIHALEMLWGELRLLLKGASWWWILCAVGLAVACLCLPLNFAQVYVYPFVWLWPLLLWSPLGTREDTYETQQLVFSAPHPLTWQLPIQWLAGMLLTLLIGSGMALHFVLAGEWTFLLALLAGSCFVPALALCVGVWTGSKRTFEIVYLVLWYAGPVGGHVAALDYMGLSAAAPAMGLPFVYALATAVLLGLALIGRRRQLYR